MEAREFVEASKSLGGFPDLAGIASRLFPDTPIDQSVESIAKIVLDYRQMWHDVRNQDPFLQSGHFKGYQPLFLDSDHELLNPNLRAEDYLEVFRSFMQRWAARKHNPDPAQNWYQAQDEFARMISPIVKPRE